jgi:hypothetical protein
MDMESMESMDSMVGGIKMRTHIIIEEGFIKVGLWASTATRH